MIAGDFVVEIPCKEQPEWVNDGGFCYLLDFFPKEHRSNPEFCPLNTLLHAPFVVDCNHHHLVIISPFFRTPLIQPTKLLFDVASFAG